jgi:hypothetical protein
MIGIRRLRRKEMKIVTFQVSSDERNIEELTETR